MSEHHQSHAYSGAKALLYRLASVHSDTGELATLHYSAKEPAHPLITVSWYTQLVSQQCLDSAFGSTLML